MDYFVSTLASNFCHSLHRGENGHILDHTTVNRRQNDSAFKLKPSIAHFRERNDAGIKWLRLSRVVQSKSKLTHGRERAVNAYCHKHCNCSSAKKLSESHFFIFKFWKKGANQQTKNQSSNLYGACPPKGLETPLFLQKHFGHASEPIKSNGSQT